MGRIDRPTRPELPESTDWMRIGKITGGVAAGALLLWIAYNQAQAPNAIRVAGGARRGPATAPQVIFVREAREEKPVPKKAEEPPPATAEVFPVHTIIQEVAVPAAVPAAAPAPEPPPPPPHAEKLSEGIHRCITLTSEIDDSQPHMSGQQVIFVNVHLRNQCDMDFPGASIWFHAVAYSSSGGIAGMDSGHFHNIVTVNGRSEADTRLAIECAPERVGHVVVKLD